MNAKGTAYKYGDNVDTDVIIPARYLNTSIAEELAQHCMEDLDEMFAKKVSPNDVVVAGENFGCGSSREHAPQIIKIAGVGAVIAKSFARIFYRNAINIGLLAIECDTDSIDDGDDLELDIEKGIITNHTNGTIIQIEPLPPVMIKLLEDGGLVEHIKKNGDFKLTV